MPLMAWPMHSSTTCRSCPASAAQVLKVARHPWGVVPSCSSLHSLDRPSEVIARPLSAGKISASDKGSEGRAR